MIKKEDVIEVLKTVDDPELMIDVWTLGLIYDIKVDKEVIRIKMTFTTPMCPYGPMLVDIAEDALKEKLKPKDVIIEVVFDPPWQPSEELRAAFGV